MFNKNIRNIIGIYLLPSKDSIKLLKSYCLNEIKDIKLEINYLKKRHKILRQDNMYKNF